MWDLSSIRTHLVSLSNDFFAGLPSYSKRVRVKGKHKSQLRRRVDGYQLARFVHAYFSLYFEGIEAYGDAFNGTAHYSHVDFGNLDVKGAFELTELPAHFVRHYGMLLQFHASHFDTFDARYPEEAGIVMDIAFDGGHIERLCTVRCHFNARDTWIGTVHPDTSFQLSACKIELLYASRVRFSSLKLIDTVVADEIQLNYCIVEEAVFDRLSVNRRAAFLACTFLQPPSTHGATFPGDTTFHASEFGPHVGLLSPFRRYGAWDGLYQRYRALRVIMKTAGAVREEAMFFGMEMRMRRLAFAAHGNPYVKLLQIDFLLSYLYDVVSGYGISIRRAIVTLLSWNLLFFLAFLLLLPANCANTAECANAGGSCRAIEVKDGKITSAQAPGICTAATLAVQNAISPASVLSSGSAVRVHSGLLIVLSLLQSIGSLSIGALLLLAIRNNFHRGS
ncbi:hypothetical protein [Janthinobacterium sp. JC611]|uniref:hypothetical protein n=1 Tax=Janthinobacterium sp. JC611 TaxID=2816201 RepID=UPI001BFEE70D|nr:hypothetical protein [Janthinobacterium sp. JC611]